MNIVEKCKQCNKLFYITKGEYNFYSLKKLSLPKNCEECRQKKKAAKAVYIK